MHWRWPCRLLVFMLAPITIHAEDGSAAWLRYAPVSNVKEYQDLPSRILVLGKSPIERSAASELERGLFRHAGTQICGQLFRFQSR
jgi:alpha-glucuronidase